MDDGERADWLDRAAAFAAGRIAPRAADLAGQKDMPADLWQGLGEAGLFSVGLPVAHGGAGGDLRLLAALARAMVAAGGNLGIVLSWMGHQLVSRLHIAGQGDDVQRRRYLPALAAGRLTPCLAISEPGAGAHPKRLAARAESDGDDIVLTGDKAFLTNGPIAGLFIVLAISGEADGRKQFSAYIVPKDTAGLTLTEGIKVDVLRPSPHCGLRLENCRIPAANRLGPDGRAFEVISLPMRLVEDAMFAANISGALDYEATALARETAGRLDDDGLAELGRLAAGSEGMGALAQRAAGLLDDDVPAAGPVVQAISAAARDWARHLQDRIDALGTAAGVTPSPARAAMARDISGMLGIARAAHDLQARKRAQSLLERAEQNSPSRTG